MQQDRRSEDPTITTTQLRLPSPSSPAHLTHELDLDDDDALLHEIVGGVHIINNHGEYDSLRRGGEVIEGKKTTFKAIGALDLAGGLEISLSRPESCAAPPRKGVRSRSMPVVERVKVVEGAGNGSGRDKETQAPTRGMSTSNPTPMDSAPSSPPALSYSKSSKSSSSSNNSDDELSEIGLAEATAHYEDVTLEDDNNLPPASRPTLRRPAPRSFTLPQNHADSARKSGISPSPTSPPAPLQLQARGNGLPSRYPSLSGAVDGALREQTLSLPRGGRRGGMQRAASSPTSPFHRQYPHSSTLAGSRSPSRSPSPGRFVSSPAALPSSASTESLSIHPHPHLQPNRKSNWQPGRKTIHELEAECNDDDDEEVPEGAILENVPISPLPGQHLSLLKSPRTSSTSLPSLRSPTPSPHRRPSYANLHSANIPKHAKRPSAPPTRNGPLRSPRSPQNGRPQMMPHSATTGQLPPRHNRQIRAKSWTEDLNEEARQLSHALFELADQNPHERKHRSMHNSPSSSPPPSDRREDLGAIAELQLPTVPDVQKGNIMIDPLPISKEKEAVLTRTRPSWLPPKDQKEEKRHLKEFQQMMARATETERKRVLKEQENRETKVEMQGNIARIWEQHVLPNWDLVVKEPRTRELWWRGVTPRNRGEVWSRAVGNELELSEASFEAALGRANALEKKIADLPDEERSSSKEAAWFEAITRDVPAVFPETDFFAGPSAALHESLTQVLKAFAMYRSDVGYVYGTHLVAAVCCTVLPAPKAFVLLANALNRPLPLAFLVHDTAAMRKAYDLTLSTLGYKYPRLHSHLQETLEPEEWLDPMFRCLFAYHLPLNLVSRIWDVWAFEGDKALIRAAVGCVGRLEGRLYGGKDEVLGVLGWGNEKGWAKEVLGEEEEFVGNFREAGKVDAERKST